MPTSPLRVVVEHSNRPGEAHRGCAFETSPAVPDARGALDLLLVVVERIGPQTEAQIPVQAADR